MQEVVLLADNEDVVPIPVHAEKLLVPLVRVLDLDEALVLPLVHAVAPGPIDELLGTLQAIVFHGLPYFFEGHHLVGRAV